MIKSILEFLAFCSMVGAPVWLAMRKPKSPSTEHCWHPHPTPELHSSTQIVLCCHCGEIFDPYDMIKRPGCGEYAPKDSYPKPTEVCTPKMSHTAVN